MMEYQLDFDRQKIGFIGEALAVYELSKHDIFLYKLPQLMDCDFVTDKGIFIEVKSGLPHERQRSKNSKPYIQYSFHNQPKTNHTSRFRICDFFMFICFETDFSINKYYIVPPKLIKSNAIAIPYKNNNTQLAKYLNNIDVLNEYKRDVSIFDFIKEREIEEKYSVKQKKRMSKQKQVFINKLIENPVAL